MVPKQVTPRPCPKNPTRDRARRNDDDVSVPSTSLTQGVDWTAQFMEMIGKSDRVTDKGCVQV